MKLNEKEKKGLVVLALLFVVYTLIVLAVPFTKGGMFWLTYLFTAAAFGVQAYVFKLSFEKEAGAKSKFYGFPIARVGVYGTGCGGSCLAGVSAVSRTVGCGGCRRDCHGFHPR